MPLLARFGFTVEAVAWRLVLGAVVRARGVGGAQRLIVRFTGRGVESSVDRASAVAVALRVERVFVALKLRRCLARSLTTWAMLRRRRLAAEVRIGVRPGAGMVDAHAWIEVGGRPLVAGEPGEYVAFDRPALS